MLKLPVKIWALHGFLGLPSDWNSILKVLGSSYEVEAVKIEPSSSLCKWAQTFNEHVSLDSRYRHFLIGYSMGGRLALHALIDYPDLWEEALLFSTHPGLKQGHAERRIKDEKWADLFEQAEWQTVVKAWMEQPVFKSTQEMPRLEYEFNRLKLAQCLRNFSLSKQALLNHKKAHFVIGEHDLSLKTYFSDLLINYSQIPSSGHRILFDNPLALIELVQARIKKLDM